MVESKYERLSNEHFNAVVAYHSLPWWQYRRRRKARALMIGRAVLANHYSRSNGVTNG